MDSIIIYERFDQHKLNYIYNNFAEITKEWDKKPDDLAQQKRRIHYILASSQDGYLEVEYRRKDQYSRWVAKNGNSIQFLFSEVRNAITKDVLVDLDFKASGYAILKALLVRNDYPDETPALDLYLSDEREFLLSEISDDRGKAKVAYTAILNGGNKIDYIANKSTHYSDLYDELQDMFVYLMDRHPEFDNYIEKLKKENNTRKKAERVNIMGKAMSKLIYREEGNLLKHLYELLGSPRTGIFMYDGIMVEPSSINHDLSDLSEVLTFEACMEEQDDIIVELVQKPIKSSIIIPDDIEPYDSIDVNNFGDYKKFRCKKYETVPRAVVNKWIHNTIHFISNGGKLHVATINKDVDIETGAPKEKIELSIVSKQFYDTLDINIAFDDENSKLDITFNEENKDKIKDKRTKESKSEQVYRSHSLQNYIQRMYKNGELHIYDYRNFVPVLRRDIHNYDFKKTFNLFRGYTYDNDSITTDVVFTESVFFNYMKTYMFTEVNDKGESELDHFLDHVADMIQRPCGPRPSAHVFVSQGQGTGKGTMMALIELMLGEDLVYSTDDAKSFMTKQFNADSANKLLTVFEEVSDNGSTVSMADMLKNITKRTKRPVEHKYSDAYVIKDFSRIWFFSQHKNILHLEPKDRRYTMHYISSEKANDTELFNAIYAELGNPKFIKAAFDFFANRQYDLNSPVKVFETKFRKEQIVRSLPSGLQFLKEYIEYTYTDDNRELADNNMIFRIPVSTLKSKFKESTGLNPKALVTQLDNVGIKQEPKKMRNNFTSTCTFVYMLSINKIRDILRKHLNQADFDFNLEVEEEDIKNLEEQQLEDICEGLD